MSVRGKIEEFARFVERPCGGRALLPEAGMLPKLLYFSLCPIRGPRCDPLSTGLVIEEWPLGGVPSLGGCVYGSGPHKNLVKFNCLTSSITLQCNLSAVGYKRSKAAS